MGALQAPGWLVIWSTIGYMAFFGIYGVEVFEEPATDDVSGTVSSASTVTDFAGDLIQAIFFGLGDSSVDLYGWLQVTLALTITTPWLLIAASHLWEAVKALGGLIPFT